MKDSGFIKWISGERNKVIGSNWLWVKRNGSNPKQKNQRHVLGV